MIVPCNLIHRSESYSADNWNNSQTNHTLIGVGRAKAGLTLPEAQVLIVRLAIKFPKVVTTQFSYFFYFFSKSQTVNNTISPLKILHS